ncbi:bifunctional 3'-5' exonuclease/DNA polymerase [Pseudarthrobacter sp. J1763]|uniref:bifunctional 3'-5' exonuclease/DNA polymerase n=1 Tax=Pseudarthrobacter sp. J1763 TaxID=3420445 RepID=UPI003D286085
MPMLLAAASEPSHTPAPSGPAGPAGAKPAGHGATSAHLSGQPRDYVYLQELATDGTPLGEPLVIHRDNLAQTVKELEENHPRWVWHRTQAFYPELLKAGVIIERCHDLQLCGQLLSYSQFSAHTDYAKNAVKTLTTEDRPEPPQALLPPAPSPDQGSLFEETSAPSGPTLEVLRAEYTQQQAALAQSQHRERLQLLLAAESAGSLIAAEMQFAGVPWREDLHEQILTEYLGSRPTGNNRPEKLEALAQELRTLLNSPTLNPDSPQELLRALHRNGIEVKSTRSWELQQSQHAAIIPLLAYKKLARLLSANGWSWLDAWVHSGRFRPEYVVGGVVSGRWASRGGGALQIPKNIRGAAHADPGFKLIVADASQLEPRVLVALAHDSKMAEAARRKDLYEGIAAEGFGGDRAKAKVALLGAIYGATTGESGRLMPQLTRMYPRAVGFVEEAARAGEAGHTVSTHLGRSTPPPSQAWLASQQSTSAEEQRRANSWARSRGRFTRNFVVQGTAAEWAACWLAELRRRLRAIGTNLPAGKRPELVFFLHDEVMVHAPQELVEECVRAIEESAQTAANLLFGRIPVDFPVTVAVVDSYDHAK